MRFVVAIALATGLAGVVLITPGHAVHKGVLPADEIRTTRDGIKYAADLDTRALSICGTCPSTINRDLVFEPSAEAQHHLAGDELILGIRVDGIARAYPVRLLERPSSHVLNDRFDDLPILVTWCPLCHSAVVFERPATNGHVLQFATAGLYRRDLVMYDAETLSLWPQLTASPIAGPLLGRLGRLHVLPAELVPWDQWMQAHPDTQVLVRWQRSGTPRRLEIYRQIGRGDGRSGVAYDPRLPARALVVGVTVGQTAKAYPNSVFGRTNLIHDSVGGVAILLLRDPQTAGVKVFGRKVGATLTLTFEIRSGRLVDTPTGTVWNYDGVAELGRLKGTRLAELPAVPAYWFAWVTFFPNTDLYR